MSPAPARGRQSPGRKFRGSCHVNLFSLLELRLRLHQSPLGLASASRRSARRFSSHSRARAAASPRLGSGPPGRGEARYRSVAQSGGRGAGYRLSSLNLPLRERVLKSAVSTQKAGGALGAYPGAPGSLSDGSPRSAMKSGTCLGSTPYRSRTSAGPMRAISPARTGWRIVVDSEAS